MLPSFTLRANDDHPAKTVPCVRIASVAIDGLDSGVSKIVRIATTDEPWPSSLDRIAVRPRPPGSSEERHFTTQTQQVAQDNNPIAKMV